MLHHLTIASRYYFLLIRSLIDILYITGEYNIFMTCIIIYYIPTGVPERERGAALRIGGRHKRQNKIRRK